MKTKMTFEELQDSMECNGYAYFNREAFINKTDEVCYIPENAKNVNECFTYNDLKKEVEEWVINNPEYVDEHKTDLDSILTWMYENLSWEFPSTWLDGLDS